MRIIIACAGTAGHITPGIAIANIVRKNSPDSEILFIGTKLGLENDIVKKAGYKLCHVRTGKLIRKLTLENVKAMYNAYVGIADAKKIIEEFKPDLVIGTGGYIAGPVMLAARKCKVPYILHESNAYPGLAVKLLAKDAACVMVGFKEAIPRIKSKNVVFTGTPSRFSQADIIKLDKIECKKNLGIPENIINSKIPIVLVTGGSQGAKKINNVILNMLAIKRPQNFFVVMATGKKNYEYTLKELEALELENKISLKNNIKLIDYIYSMEEAYVAADLVVARSGAMTVIEHMVASKPSILIPFPYATENHQLYNAKVLEEANAAKIIIESELTHFKIYETIKGLIDNKETLANMAKNAGSKCKDDVSLLIYKHIKESLK